MINKILIKNVQLDMRPVDIYIEKERIRQIGEQLDVKADKVIDGTDKAVIPGFVNGHTHAAMTLFRGYADDMKLMPWLEEKIWPILTEKCKEECERLYRVAEDYGSRVQYTVGPHAIYTVSGELLQWIHAFARERNVRIHLHLAETEEEVRGSVEKFGLTPVRYLYKLGVLSPRLVIAHGIYVDADEIRMLADHGVKVVHNPASNLKLASGIRFPFVEMKRAGIQVGLGTDGCSSSNNLDMVEAMKLAALVGKAWRKDPEVLTAQEVFEAATAVGADILGLDAGRVEVGRLADLCLVDLKQPAFVPNFNFISNLVYAANGSCIDTVLCHGKVLMENRKVPGEEEILEKTARLAYDLIKR